MEKTPFIYLRFCRYMIEKTVHISAEMQCYGEKVAGMCEAESNLRIKKKDSSLKLFVVMAKAYLAVMEEAALDIKSKGLNFTEFAVLELLYHNGEQSLQKIGKKILLTSGSITYVINKLEKKGLVRREQSVEDRRITYAIITGTGRELMDSVFPEHWEKIRNIMSALTEEEREAATLLLKKLGTSISKI